jgi:putative hydrolase of the HAD superfamily
MNARRSVDESMRSKIIMVDVDGVVITHPDERGWSANLERDLGISPNMLQQLFFEPHWDDIVRGRASLRDRLTSVLPRLSVTATCDDLIDYWFSNDAHIDDRLIAELQSLRHDGIEVHLATVQEHERANYIWERLDFQSKFDGMHYAAALGCCKPEEAFYRLVEAAVGARGDAIFFIDDRFANVAGARACGWTAALWTGEETLAQLMGQHHWNHK